MEKHPFFMKKLPENEELSPLLQGLQQLKYDETLNSPNGKLTSLGLFTENASLFCR